MRRLCGVRGLAGVGVGEGWERGGRGVGGGWVSGCFVGMGWWEGKSAGGRMPRRSVFYLKRVSCKRRVLACALPGFMTDRVARVDCEGVGLVGVVHGVRVVGADTGAWQSAWQVVAMWTDLPVNGLEPV